MSTIRQARQGESDRQKEIWKLCFGDDDDYIDFYYSQRYKEDETILLLQAGEIAAMLTIIPVKMVTAKQSFNAAMLYAIATHPQYQHRGLARQLIDYTNNYLSENNFELSLLVPAEQQLFDFYDQQGYRQGCYLREGKVTWEQLEQLPGNDSCQGTITAITPLEYNRRRNEQLRGNSALRYADEDITYQKKLSQQSGADIYALDFAEIKGCAVIERVSPDKVLIKELLLPEKHLNRALKLIAQLLVAQEYVLRTPAYIGEDWGGLLRPFGMWKSLSANSAGIMSSELGYLGLAFD